MRRQTLAISQPLSRTSTAKQQPPIAKPQPVSALTGLVAYAESEDSDDDNLDLEPLQSQQDFLQQTIASTTSNDHENDKFVAFMADIKSTTSIAPSVLNGVNRLENISLPSDLANRPNPLPPASTFSAPLSLPALTPDTPTSLIPPLSSSPLHTRLARILARFDQLPALPVHLPEAYSCEIRRLKDHFDAKCHDWLIGALLDAYFNAVLDVFEDTLIDFIEVLYSPMGWNIHWDEATESHYFECKKNGEVSWSWPEISTENYTNTQPTNKTDVEKSKESNTKLLAIDKSAVTTEPVKKLMNKKLTEKPQTVSISAKSKKMASMLQKWHVAKAELRQDEIDDEGLDAEEQAFEKLQEWAQSRASVDSDNPNFAPVVPRSKRQRESQD
ncbi:hypothetical protein HK100_007958 [Physocladia obscura]|uniref:WW domain-containing protein n=1 Tax=Physocladia obscura TaxID=109957 RepID=A0AAD5TAX7_9FUNG|nr:hypothetical protein HK100_007958 [Physocladia obscura]